ncbi:MAG: sensor histidine kinase N-terminal domain-containing protein [Sphingomonadales bacterium]|nr:sensor histidine kinase N-terminal domain-containing protein [Sphingomonadales bacterium]
MPIDDPQRFRIVSLTERLLRSMVLPIAGIAIILGIGGSWAVAESVEAVNDRILGAASRAIAESLTIEDDQVALDLSPAIFGMLETAERDNVYYSVRHRGQLLTGYSDLPNIAPGKMSDGEVMYGRAQYLGRELRIVAEARRLPGIADPVIVEVAETLGARDRMTRQLYIGLALLEIVLIAVMALLLPRAVRWGLKPVLLLRDEMDERQPSDLTPLPLTKVPTELRDLVTAFNGMLSRLDEANDGMRRFTADASHQMRTPLSILRGHIAVLQSSAIDDAQAKTSIADIDQATERLSRLLIQLLALARADSAATAAVEPEAVDMNALVADIAAERSIEALKAGIDLHFERSETPPIAMTQPVLAGELVANLVDNAIRYNNCGREVGISIASKDGQVVVAVEDDGPGIAPEERERMFTRFTRLPRAADRGGSGLGLSIVRALARAIGAEVRLSTASNGRGLRAEVILPPAN